MGMSHGVVCTVAEPKKKMIFAQVIFNNLQFTGERWVDPDEVLETVPAERISPHLAKYFKEMEENQA